MKFRTQYFWILTPVIWLVPWIMLAGTPYDAFFDKLSGFLGIADKRTAFQAVFTPAVYARIQTALAGMFVLHLAATVVIFRNRTRWQGIGKQVWRSLNLPAWLKQQYRHLSVSERGLFWGFLLLLALHRLYFICSAQVIYDEAFTWLSFTSKNPLVAGCFYPSSNNHILFSHCTQLTALLPFHPLINLRIAALIPNLLFHVILLFGLRKYFSPSVAWIGVVLVALSFPVTYYGYVARGYSLLLVFFTLAFFTTLSLVRFTTDVRAWIRLSASCIAGLYTIPVFLYPAATLFAFLLAVNVVSGNRKAVNHVLIAGCCTLIGSILLYLPVFVVSGTDAVLNHKYVKSLTLADVFAGFKEHIANNLQFFSGLSLHVLTASILVFCLVFYLANIRVNKKYGFLPVFCFALAPVLMFAHRIIPVERTWMYLIIPFVFMIGTFLKKRFTTIMALLLLTPALIYGQMQHTKLWNWYDTVCLEDARQGDYFTSFFKGKKITLYTATRMNTYLRFYAITQHEAWQIESDADPLPAGNTYIIQYLDDEKPDPEVPGFATRLEYKGYRLLESVQP